MRHSRKHSDPVCSARRAWFTAAMLCALVTTSGSPVWAEKRPLTVADAIETTRFVAEPQFGRHGNRGHKEPQRGVFVSPDGKYYAVLLVRGDVERNGLWLEVVSGRLDSLETAARPITVGKLFATILGSDHDLNRTMVAFPSANPVTWIDNESLGFLWNDSRNVTQAYVANLRTRTVQPLTQHPTGVFSYDVSARGDVAYAALYERNVAASQALLERGFVVTNADALSLVSGNLVTDIYCDSSRERFLQRRDGSLPRALGINDRFRPHTTLFSPDGKLLLLDAAPAEVPDRWRAYTNRITRLRIHEYRHVSRHTPQAHLLQQFFLHDIESGVTRPFWDAPTYGSTRAAWSPDSKLLLLGPAFTPPEGADANGLEGKAIVIVDVESGRYTTLLVNEFENYYDTLDLHWLSNRVVEIGTSSHRLRFERHGSGWRLAKKAGANSNALSTSGVRVEWRQDLNTPPALYAVDRRGRERVVLDPNPALMTGLLLGRVEHVHWQDPEDRTWSGLLYYPVGYEASRRYPLVIQTHGHALPTEFSLYGYKEPGLGPGTSVYSAQVLANRQMAVLQVEDRPLPGIKATPGEANAFMGAYEGAIQFLVDKGLVDRERVGLVGFSRTGWHVEYAISHSEFPFAASLATDNFDASYMGAAFLGWASDYSRVNGGEPFGDGLLRWLEQTPAFNAHRIRTPHRMQEEGSLVEMLSRWEMFSRLRYLGKPVEFVAIPNVNQGAHFVQNPAQVLASQQGAVDWFDFWLNGYEDPDPAKADQYDRWRKMRDQQRQSVQGGIGSGKAGEP